LSASGARLEKKPETWELLLVKIVSRDITAVIVRPVILGSTVPVVMLKLLYAILAHLVSIKTTKVNLHVWHAIVANTKIKPGKNIASTVL
jgi:hypothetical protein